MYSTLILTKDEEQNLPDCIASVQPCDDVWVLDSGSDDATAKVAERMGAEVRVRPFDNYAAQRNAGLALPFKHDWIVMLDADERLSPELSVELREALDKATPEVDAFFVRRKDMFMGRWIRRSSGYPTWFARVLRKGRVSVARSINETYEFSGKSVFLREHLIHFPFNKGLHAWFDKHNRYSTMEAAVLERERVSWEKLLSTSPVERRKALKQLAYRMPGRPLATFAYLYGVRGGFLDGKAGFHFASMRAAYEVMIDAKRSYNRSHDPSRKGIP